LIVPRDSHSATLLADGRVLVAGGSAGFDRDRDNFRFVGEAEVYDPATGQWALAGMLCVPRIDHQALLLPNDQVLVVGGDVQGDPGRTATTELYDPATNTWQLTGSLSVPRTEHSVTLLLDGRVLVVGGPATASEFA
jgi:N-acetylneuraminic acid mutarotase